MSVSASFRLTINVFVLTKTTAADYCETGMKTHIYPFAQLCFDAQKINHPVFTLYVIAR